MGARIPDRAQSGSVAVDGNTMRASADHDEPMVRLVTVLDQAHRTVLPQKPMVAEPNEIPAFPQALPDIDPVRPSGTVVTADAMRCQRASARSLHETGTYYVPTSRATSPAFSLLSTPWTGRRPRDHSNLDTGHGRIEVRMIQVRMVWAEGSNSAARPSDVRTEQGSDRGTPAGMRGESWALRTPYSVTNPPTTGICPPNRSNLTWRVCVISRSARFGCRAVPGAPQRPAEISVAPGDCGEPSDLWTEADITRPWEDRAFGPPRQFTRRSLRLPPQARQTRLEWNPLSVPHLATHPTSGNTLEQRQ